MTDEEKAEVIDTFISIGEKFLKGNKHFHVEPILARDTIQAIKELKEEIADLKEQIQEQQIIAMQRIADKELKIVNLEEQIEKMKCCGNCKHGNQHYYFEPCKNCGGCNKWEITE